MMRNRRWTGLLLGVALLLLLLLGTRVRSPRPQAERPGNVPGRVEPSRASLDEARSSVPSLLQPGSRVSVKHQAAPQSVFERLIERDDEVLRLPRERIDSYLALNHTNADSLLAAWQAAGDREYLKRAAAQFPDDPKVLVSVITMDVFPERRREWIDRLKRSAPDNPLANYLSARDYLAAGQSEQALRELAEAQSKGGYSDYTAERLQDLEEIQLLSGRTPSEAKAIAGSGLLLPHLKSLRELGEQLSTLERNCVARGDLTAAQGIALAGWSLTENLTSGETAQAVVHQRIGLRIREQLLEPLPSETTADFLQGTPRDALARVAARKEALESLSPLFDQMLARGDEPEIIAFFDRMKLYGEEGALKWLQSRAAP